MVPRPLAYAPLIPFAAAVTAGIAFDHFLPASTLAALVFAGIALIGWVATIRRQELVGLACLWAAAGGLAAAYHHAWRNDFQADDVGAFAATEPALTRLRGTLSEEPSFRRHPKEEALRARPKADATIAVLRVVEVEAKGEWQRASGLARLSVDGPLDGFHVGDEVEVTGWLSRPHAPLNPGEMDFASHLLDDRIRAALRVRKSADTVVRLSAGTPWNVTRVLSSLRGWSQHGIDSALPHDESGIAAALLLGETTAMTADEWDRYVRTGVIHVLAISGQHLVVLGAFLWLALRVVGVRRRPSAVTVAVVLLAYALLTGGRPSAMRAAVMMGAACGGVLLRKPALPANTLALSWIVVLALNPTDLFNAGFQLSFLCVAVLVWGIPRWFSPRELTPLEQLIEESRSLPERFARGVLHAIGRAYLITAVLGVATAPLIMYWQNLISPAGFLIGPAAILLTSIALIAGFILMLTWPLGTMAAPAAWATGQSLALCEWVVRRADGMPGGCWYVGSVPAWWVVGFYIVGVVWLTISGTIPATRLHRRFAAGLVGWCILGLLAGTARPAADDLRVTFVAVEHGGCTVIETPDGRVLLYDAGATGGPDVTKRHIAPYLWSRGIRRIDEVFLSHADLDHFNGLPALLDRFPVGRVTFTPTFAEKPTAGVRKAVEVIEARGVVVRKAVAGDRFSAGNLEIDVLHPPPDGPPGVENVRSLVLLLRHAGHSILLTGDLEGAGLDLVLQGQAPAIDVLMTPHHGSGSGGERLAALAAWAKPRLVVACQGPTDAGKAEAIYRRTHTPYWATWPHGAITIRSHSSGLVAETFATGQRLVVRGGSVK